MDKESKNPVSFLLVILCYLFAPITFCFTIVLFALEEYTITTIVFNLLAIVGIIVISYYHYYEHKIKQEKELRRQKQIQHIKDNTNEHFIDSVITIIENNLGN